MANTWAGTIRKTRKLAAEREAFLLEAEEMIDDFFAFQAAACTASPDCDCGRPSNHPIHERKS